MSAPIVRFRVCWPDSGRVFVGSPASAVRHVLGTHPAERVEWEVLPANDPAPGGWLTDGSEGPE